MKQPENELTKRFWPEWLPRVLFESALIVFSVLLALGLNEWVKRGERLEHSRATVTAIVEELRHNRDNLEKARRRHESISTQLKDIAEADQMPTREFALSGLFRPTVLQQSAWHAAQDDGLSALDFELQLDVSRVYAFQEDYTLLADRLVADMYDEIRRRGPEHVLINGFEGFQTLALDFSRRERTLVKELDSVLDRLQTIAY